MWPFKRAETAVQQPPAPVEARAFTDVVTNALLEAATDSAADGYLAALEIAAGQLARAFASATPAGSDAGMFDADVLAQIGRALLEDGEAVWFRVGQKLVRAENYGLDPDGRYTINNAAFNATVEGSRVMHARWALDVASRRGRSPLATARTLRQLMERVEKSLSDESNAAVGYLLPIPQDGAAGNAERLRADLAGLKGRIAVIETTRGGWGEGAAAAPRRDYDLARMGPAYPDSSIALFLAARDTVLAACGLPVQLVNQGDGTGQREAWRRYLHGTVAPLGELVAIAARRAGLDVTLQFDQLFASDIQGRARAFQSLVKAGLSVEAAAAASGILDLGD